MPNLLLIPGTSTKANFPYDSGCPKCPSFCHSIEGRYSVGTYHVPALLNPHTSVELKELLAPYAVPTPVGDIFEPILIWRAAVPSKHVTRGIAVEASEISETCIADRRCCSSDPTGIRVAVVTQLFDHDAWCADGACAVDDYLIGAINEVVLDVDPTVDSWQHFDFDNVIEAGQILLVGFRIDVLPDDPAALKCAKMDLSAVVLADSYTHPLQND